jgi:PHD/YefM family antitoxin component YafN of YafNO toxin-antitoxin module
MTTQDHPRGDALTARNRPIGYTHYVLIETLSAREAREQLSTVLERFRNGDRTPVGVGSHRRTEAVMVPAEVFDELMAERARAVIEAAASLRAEGLVADADVTAITDRWARGEISTAQMRELVRHLYGVR